MKTTTNPEDIDSSLIKKKEYIEKKLTAHSVAFSIEMFKSNYLSVFRRWRILFEIREINEISKTLMDDIIEKLCLYNLRKVNTQIHEINIF